jgi:hypothetical protein
MKNNSMLILLAVVLVFSLLCAIAGGLAMSYYKNGFPSLSQPKPEPLMEPQDVPRDADTLQQNETPAETGANALSNGNADVLYTASLMQKYQVCQNSISFFMATIFELEADPNLQQDAGYLQTLKADLEKIQTNCGNLGSEKDVPPAFTAVNAELLLVNQDVKQFSENYLLWIENPQLSYILEGNKAFYSAVDRMQNANTLLQEAMQP